MAEVGAVGVDLEGNPDIGFGIGKEGFSEDPDDGAGLVAERDAGAHNVGIAAELTLPESVANHDDMAAVRGVFLRCEGAAKLDWRAKEPEIGFGDVEAVDLLGNDAGKVEARTAKVVSGDVLKDAGLSSPGIEVDRRGRIAVAVGIGVHEPDHAVGLGIGEWLEQDSVDDGEDGGVGSDAEGESGDGGNRKGRAGDEHTQGVAEVAEEVAHGMCRLNAWVSGGWLAYPSVPVGRGARTGTGPDPDEPDLSR